MAESYESYEYYDSKIEEKKKEMKAIKNKKNIFFLIGLLVGVITLALLIYGGMNASKYNVYEQETVLFEYQDFDPAVNEHLEKVKANITGLMLLYSVDTKYADGTPGVLSNECYLAITEDGDYVFILNGLGNLHGGMDRISNELGEKGVAEVRGDFTTVTIDLVMDVEIDSDVAESIANTLCLLGVADPQALTDVLDDPQNIKKVINQAIRNTGAIELRINESNTEVNTVYEETPESIMGKRFLYIAAVFAIFTVALLIYSGILNSKVAAIDDEIWHMKREQSGDNIFI